VGVIIDNKLTFREHITYVTEKCRKIIFALSKSAKLNWGLSHKALKTLYTEGIQPLLLYGAPVWAEILEKTSHKIKLTRVQRLINIKIAKAYRTVSNEVLCIITGLTPIHIKIQKTVELYKIFRGNRYKNLPIDHDKLPRQWFHPAARIIATGDTDDQTPINIYTDGGKSEQGVGAGIVIKRPGTPNITLMYRMNNRCSNNQAEAFAILKALEYLQTTQTKEEDKAVTLHTDSTTTLDLLINTDIHTFLTEEIRQTVHELETREWKIRFRWVKAHAETSGNELADKLTKEASGKTDLLISYNRGPKSVIKRDLENTSVETWQGEWDTITKERITKDYFPKVAERLHTKIHLTQNFTTMVTVHGNIKSYLHRFKIIDAPNCPCGNDNQTTEHILLECAIFHEDRERLIASVAEEES
jgi:ribonuclease HI